MKLLKIVILLFGLFLLSEKGIAQEVWSLEKCIDYALEHNIQIKQQELNAKYSENSLLQSKLNLLPNLNGNTSLNNSFGRSVDPYTYDYTTENVQSMNFSLSSSVTLFSGLRKLNTIKQNEFNLLGSLQDVEKTKNDISLNITAAFLQILFNEEILVIAQKQLEITNLQIDRTKKLVEAGSLAKGNLLEVQAQQAAEELQVVNSQNQLDFSYLTLIQLLELERNGNFEIEHPELPEIDENVSLLQISSIFQQGVSFLPQIKSAEYQLLSSEKALAIAKSSQYPTLSLSASIYSGYSNNRLNSIIQPSLVESQLIGHTIGGEEVWSEEYTSMSAVYETYAFSDQIKDNSYKSLGFNLSIPIFNNWQVYTAVKNSKISLLNSEYNLELQKNLLYKEIQNAHADAIAAQKKYISTKKAVLSIEESFRYTQQKYDVGLVNSVDYNIAKNKLSKTQSELLQAKFDYIFKSKILDFYSGKPIDL